MTNLQWPHPDLEKGVATDPNAGHPNRGLVAAKPSTPSAENIPFGLIRPVDRYPMKPC